VKKACRATSIEAERSGKRRENGGEPNAKRRRKSGKLKRRPRSTATTKTRGKTRKAIKIRKIAKTNSYPARGPA